MVLGAGRERLDSTIDPAVGLIFEKKVGDRVQPGERICAVHYNDRSRLTRAVEMVKSAITISAQPPQAPALILD